eukprot:m.864201 g.864201  ORF g.864201 m.864201 type:complete len:230 (+) comp59708_c0_seq3:92-781(+)
MSARGESNVRRFFADTRSKPGSIVDFMRDTLVSLEGADRNTYIESCIVELLDITNNSKTKSEQLGGFRALDAFVQSELDNGDMYHNIAKGVQQHFPSAGTDEDIMRAAALLIGKVLDRWSSYLATSFVLARMSRAIEYMNYGVAKAHDSRRLAAVLVIQQLATHQGAVLQEHLAAIFNCLFLVIKDPRVCVDAASFCLESPLQFSAACGRSGCLTFRLPLMIFLGISTW